MPNRNDHRNHSSSWFPPSPSGQPPSNSPHHARNRTSNEHGSPKAAEGTEKSSAQKSADMGNGSKQQKRKRNTTADEDNVEEDSHRKKSRGKQEKTNSQSARVRLKQKTSETKSHKRRSTRASETEEEPTDLSDSVDPNPEETDGEAEVLETSITILQVKKMRRGRPNGPEIFGK
jgi:hypothetical protein